MRRDQGLVWKLYSPSELTILRNDVFVWGGWGRGLPVIMTGRGVKPAKWSTGFASPCTAHLTTPPNRGPERSSHAAAVTQPGAQLTPEPALSHLVSSPVFTSNSTSLSGAPAP